MIRNGCTLLFARAESTAVTCGVCEYLQVPLSLVFLLASLVVKIRWYRNVRNLAAIA
jgi:hypothetical protein